MIDKLLRYTAIRYGIIGASGQAIDYLITLFLVTSLVPLLWSNAIAYAVASTLTYIGHTLITFRSRARQLLSPKRISNFTAACMLGLASGTLFLFIGSLLGMPFNLNKICQLVSVAGVQYAYNRWVTFRAEK